jgi:hypothetical protein
MQDYTDHLERVTFGSDGVELVGELRAVPRERTQPEPAQPESTQPAHRLPGLVFTGPFTGVKEQNLRQHPRGRRVRHPRV